MQQNCFDYYTKSETLSGKLFRIKELETTFCNRKAKQVNMKLEVGEIRKSDVRKQLEDEECLLQLAQDWIMRGNLSPT